MTIGRRDVLWFVGGLAVWAETSGCALLRGGAVHPKLKSGARLEGTTLRVPLGELAPVKDGRVLQIVPPAPYPELVVAMNGDAFVVAAAECTHLGCTVDWERASRSWLCPCHDSRFSPDGSVANGPADKPLAVPGHRLSEDALEIDLGALRTA